MNSVMMKYIFMALLVIFASIATWLPLKDHIAKTYPQVAHPAGPSPFVPKNKAKFIKADHTEFTVTEVGDYYRIQYDFKGPRLRMHHFDVLYPKIETDTMVARFGIPKSMFNSYSLTPTVLEERKRILAEGLWEQRGRFMEPDKNAILNYYKSFTYPIARFTKEKLGDQQDWRNTITFLLRFCQDISYGTPPEDVFEKDLGGIFSPPQLLLNGFGDCDSKSTLFFSALSHFTDYDDAIFIHLPNHVLVGIRGVPGPYDSFYTFQNKKYIFAEPVGLGRWDLGKNDNSYQTVKQVIPVSFSKDYPLVKTYLTDYDDVANILAQGEKAPDLPDPVVPEPAAEKESLPMGAVTFYSTMADEGNITIYINDEKVGILDKSFTSKPPCGADGTLLVERPIGNYDFKAETEKGSVWMSQIKIKTSGCSQIRLGN